MPWRSNLPKATSYIREVIVAWLLAAVMFAFLLLVPLVQTDKPVEGPTMYGAGLAAHGHIFGAPIFGRGSRDQQCDLEDVARGTQSPIPSDLDHLSRDASNDTEGADAC